MQKIRNREKIFLKSFKIFYIPLFIIIFIILIFFYFKDNLKNLLYENIQKKSDQFGYVLQKIEINNTKYLTTNKVLEIVKPNLGKSIFFISLKNLHQEISSIKWVDKLNLKVNYPSKLIINLEEKIPLGIFKKDREIYYYIDKNGKIIDLVKNLDNKNLIIISGEAGLSDASKLINKINLLKNINVKSAEYIGSRRWDIITNQNLRIKLPEENYEIALKDLNNIFLDIEKLKRNTIQHIDLRFSKKAIIMFNNKETIDILNK